MSARADGRPLYFDVAPHQKCQCVVCLKGGIQTAYPFKHVFMNDPANPVREEMEPGSVNTVCKTHLPDNVVIFSPWSGECRDKDGTKQWRED